MTRRMLAWVAVALLEAGPAAVANAQIPGLKEWAESASTQGQPKWKGPRTPFPRIDDRPVGFEVLRSLWRPLAVHAPPDVPADVVIRALEALESAADTLEAAGWPAPTTDGGRGGTASFDLYLQSQPERAFGATDAPLSWSYLDAASTYAVVDPGVPAESLRACIASAFVDAVLLGQDPAEAPAWRSATAAYLAWLIDGRFGCDDDVTEHQRDPSRSWISFERPHDHGGALLLATISEQNDAQSGTFFRELWQHTRQRTWEGLDLRASPDLWTVLAKALNSPSSRLESVVQDAAVARFFAGTSHRKIAATSRVLSQLSSDAEVPLLARVRFQDLPRHSKVTDPPLEAFGSAYMLVDTHGAPRQSQLRVWLDGELGVRWTVSAVRLDSGGRELSRIATPQRRTLRDYMVVELSDQTESVLLVVTNLGNGIPDADRQNEYIRAVKLIVSR